MTTKYCSHCDETKPKREFHRHPSNEDGLFRICRKCRAEVSGWAYVPIAPEGYKQCKICNEVQLLDDFHRMKGSADGRNTICKKCRSRAKPKPIVRDGYKLCHDCKQELPASIDYFKVDRRSKDSLGSICKKCASAYSKKWRERQIEADPDYYKKLYQRYRERHLARGHRWYRQNKDRHREYQRQWREENREKYLAMLRNYYQKNRETIINRVKQWRKENSKQYRRYNREWLEANPQKAAAIRKGGSIRRRARERNLPDNFTAQDWLNCLDYWNNQCAVCGIKSEEVLHADHWIPLFNDNSPGTVVNNIICLCRHCNHTKSASDPVIWLIEKLGKELGQKKLLEIEEYFELVNQ